MNALNNILVYNFLRSYAVSENLLPKLFLLNSGRQYDKNGNLRQWWNNNTILAFRKRAQCVVDQYSNYKLEPFGLQVSPSPW